MRKHLIVWAVLICIVLFAALPVSANTAPSAWAGASGSELLVAENSPVRVESEHLVFTVEQEENRYTLQSVVTARYSMHNPLETSVTVSAVFPVISSNRLEKWNDHQITLDGEPIAFDVVYADLSDKELMEDLNFGDLLAQGLPTGNWTSYKNHSYKIQLLTFELVFPPEKTVELEIVSATQAFMEEDRLWHYIPIETRYTFGYFLSPAQYWASFGDITIEVLLTPQAPMLKNASLPFEYQGGRYIYHGDSLPEGELQFTAVSNIWMLLGRSMIWLVLVVLAVTVLVKLLIVLIRYRRRR